MEDCTKKYAIICEDIGKYKVADSFAEMKDVVDDMLFNNAISINQIDIFHTIPKKLSIIYTLE